MNQAFLLIGGNIGDRLLHLRSACSLLKNCGSIKQLSSVYETAAWGNTKQNSFLNQAIELETTFSGSELLKCVLEIEKKMGRQRMEKYGPRLIDIDILLFNNNVINEAALKVPHPQLPHRRFALQCLNDIAATIVHPLLNKSIQQLLDECRDPLQVQKLGDC